MSKSTRQSAQSTRDTRLSIARVFLTQKTSLERRAIDALLALAYATYCALDDSEELPDGSLSIDKDNGAKLCAALEKLDELPDDQPGYTMGPAAKAGWALRSLIGAGK